MLNALTNIAITTIYGVEVVAVIAFAVDEIGSLVLESVHTDEIIMYTTDFWVSYQIV